MLLSTAGCGSHSSTPTAAPVSARESPSAAATAPSAREDAAISFDPTTGRLILFGGLAEQCTPHVFAPRERADAEAVWVLEGKKWVATHPKGAPDAAAVIAGSMAYDPALHEIVYVGTGRVGAKGPQPTWLTDGSTWRRAPGLQAPLIDAPGMAYSAHRRAVVVWPRPYGGALRAFDGSWKAIASPPLDSATNWLGVTGTQHPGWDLIAVSSSAYGGSTLRTWVNSGGTWRQLPTTTPAPMSLGWAVLSPTPDGAGVLLAAAPVYRGANPIAWQLGSNQRWTPLRDSGPLTDRVNESFAYDSRDHRILMFGGSTRDGRTKYDDTWSFDGTAWTLLNPGTGPTVCAQH